MYGDISGSSILVSWLVYGPVSILLFYCLVNSGSEIFLEANILIPPCPVVLINTVWAICCLLCFHVYFMIPQSSSVLNDTDVLHEI